MEVMVPADLCDEIREKLKPFAKSEPTETAYEGRSDMKLLVYTAVIDDPIFLRTATDAGAQSVKRRSG